LRNKESRNAGTNRFLLSCFPYSLLGRPARVYVSSMRVLIVGCGYVGVPLGAELVQLGHEVFGLRRNLAAKNELKAAGIQPLFGDVTKPDELKNLPRDFDWVVNCVAAGGDADNYREIYFNGTKNLSIRAARAFTHKTMVRRSMNPARPSRRQKLPKSSSRRKKFCSTRRRKKNFWQ